MRASFLALPALAGALVLASLGASDPAAAGAATSSAPRAAGAAHYRIDPVHSSLLFRVHHVGAAYFYGAFRDLSGSIVYDPENPKNCSVQVEVKTESVDTRSEQRDAHLKSSDFLDAKQFPTMTFTSSAVSRIEKDRYRVEGELEIRGRKKKVEFEMQMTGEGEFHGKRIGFEATFTIRRSDFGVNYMPEGLGDEVKVIVSLEGVQEDV